MKYSKFQYSAGLLSENFQGSMSDFSGVFGYLAPVKFNVCEKSCRSLWIWLIYNKYTSPQMRIKLRTLAVIFLES